MALARQAAENRCRDISILDLRGISQVTDFFVIATGTSSRQMRSVIGRMEDFVSAHRDVTQLGREGLTSDRWALFDLVDVVVHLFAPDARRFYDLELLWGDAPRIDWQTGYEPPPKVEQQS